MSDASLGHVYHIVRREVEEESIRVGVPATM